jgi:membrane-associated phospholipid phosphatase
MVIGRLNKAISGHPLANCVPGEPHAKGVQQPAPNRYRQRVRPTSVVLLWVLLAILAVIVRVGAFPGDVPLAATLSAHNALPLRLLSAIGSVPVWSALVVLTAAALWWWQWRTAALWLLITDFSAEAASYVVKAIVNRPRPLGTEVADIIATASFPSGHIVRTTAALGFVVAALAWRRPVWRVPALAATVLFLLLLGVARVASGEHWPSDVLGGYLLGTAWLGTITMLPWYRRAIESGEPRAFLAGGRAAAGRVQGL